MSNPVADIRRILEATTETMREPLSPTVDENGVVVLVNNDGHPRVWMSQETAAAFAKLSLRP